MVIDISLLSWLNLVVAFALFLGPGLALAGFIPQHRRLDRTSLLLLALAFSLSFWAVLLAWLQPTGIRLTRYSSAMIFLLGWAVAIWRWWPDWKERGFWSPLADLPGLGTWAAALMATGFGLYNVRTLVAGMGSDAYHHTLIANLIMTQGRLPDNYLPLIPLSSFSYHYGYHALLAALDWWSAGIPGRLMAVVLFPVLVGFSALAAGSMAKTLTGSRFSAPAAACLTGLVAIFPTFMGNWGRYTQITGTLLLMVFMMLIWRWCEAGFAKGWFPWVAVLAAGLGLTHYRVALMAAFGAAALLLAAWLFRLLKASRWRVYLLAWGGALLAAVLLALPWFIHILSQRQTGYAFVLSTPDVSAGTLARFGAAEQHYATTPVLLVLVLAALVIGLARRSRVVIWVVIWTGLMVLFSQPLILGETMDFPSVVISSYVPASILVGWLASTFIESRIGAYRWARLLAIVALGSLSWWGIATASRNVAYPAAMVRLADLGAAEWASVNTPPQAVFAVNTHHWNFRPDYVIGADAGYWLPLLANRRTITLPMIYPVERASQPGLNESLVALDSLEGRLTTPQAVAELARQEVTHVFIGEFGKKIIVDDLLTSSHFRLLYNQGESYIFEFIP